MKHTKQEAGRKGGRETVRKHGRAHMSEIGRRGASVTHERYHLAPIGTSNFAMVDRQTGKVKAYMFDASWQRPSWERDL